MTAQTSSSRQRHLTPAQQRFYLSRDDFLNLVGDLKSQYAGDCDVEVGIAFHSLRAINIDTIRRVKDAYRVGSPDGVIHMHIAEQTKEIDDCVAAHRRRSVRYLYSEIDVDDRWCLVHAIHLTDDEVRLIAKSGAIAGLCPTTEANLGDGILPAPEFLSENGLIAIGSDSHISVSPRSELRLLEYGQRLTRRARALLGTEPESVGSRLYHSAAVGGAAAIGVATGSLEVGNRTDIVVLDPSHPAIANASNDRVLDRFAFCDAGNPFVHTICRGR